MSTLQTACELEGRSLFAVDDEIGRVEGLYFDDTTWAIRYLSVTAGDRLPVRHVLIAPVAISDINHNDDNIYIEMTRNQIENSPPFGSAGPLARQFWREYHQYDCTPCWQFRRLSGFPMLGTTTESPPASLDFIKPGNQEKHLHNTSKVNGFTIRALDRDIGQVEDFILDTRYWVIRYLGINSVNKPPGKRLLLNPGWIEEICWPDHTISVDLTPEEIESAPHFGSSKMPNQENGAQLFKHYARPVFWCSVNS